MAEVSLPVVLIGPVNAGKSTTAPMLAARLEVEHVDLDELCWDYFEADPEYDEEAVRSDRWTPEWRCRRAGRRSLQ